MESPRKRIMHELRNDDNRNFALIINDIPILDGKHQVYVKSQQNNLVTVAYKRTPNRLQSTEVDVNLDRYWDFLATYSKFYGFDFGPYMQIPDLGFKVTVNRSFGMLFIESPAMTFVKDCITQAAGRSLNTLSVQGLSTEFWEALKARWYDIQAEFQVTAVKRYIILLTQTVKRKINSKMFYEKNRLFKESIVTGKTNFLHLFLRTPGLYNPFLEDKQLMANTRNSWFTTEQKISRLYLRDTADYELYCMTVNDFCRSIGLETKVGFTAESALYFLLGLLYTGSYNNIAVPTEHMTGYLVVDMDPDTNKIVSADHVTLNPGPGAGHYERVITKVNGLEAFITRYGMQLGLQTGMNTSALKALLNKTHLQTRE